MTFKDLLKLYEEKKKKYGIEAYRHISKLLIEAKEMHKSDWLKNPTPKKDHEQSWKGFKGNNLEKLIVHRYCQIFSVNSHRALSSTVFMVIKLGCMLKF